MGGVNDLLEPTLWRTCRMLTSPVRRRVLHSLLNMQRACVSEIAADTALPPWSATRALRALQARGLVQARPEGRWVFYRAVANPRVQHASDVLTAVAASLSEGEAGDAVTKALTAYTHPRRIAIVNALGRGAADTGRLAAQCRISRMALHRHLDKLLRREVIEPCADGYRIRKPPTRLGRALLAIATDVPEPGGA